MPSKRSGSSRILFKEFEIKANEVASLALDIVMDQKRAGGNACAPINQACDQAVVLLAGQVNLAVMLFKVR